MNEHSKRLSQKRRALYHPHPYHIERYKPTNTYYWIVGVSDSTGRCIIYGCKNTYEEAYQQTQKIINAETEIIPLQTRDSKLASAKIKEMRQLN